MNWIKRKGIRKILLPATLVSIGVFFVGSILLSVSMFFLSFSYTNQHSGDCSSAYASPVTATDKDMESNAKQIYVEVKKAIPEATPQGLCGMLGNFQQESTMSPKAVENANPTCGHGLAQWTGGRCTALMNFAQEKGKDWTDLGLQIQYLITELKGAESAGQKALKETDVHQATTEWQTTFERAGKPVMGNRLTYADHWYAVLGTTDPVAGSTQGTGSGSESGGLDCSSSTDSSDILTVAKGWLGWFHYEQIHPAPDLGTDLKNPNKTGHTDCSGYVWLVLNKAGYSVPGNMGWFTGSMASDAKGPHKYFKQIAESEAQAGDVVIVNVGAGGGDGGHTGLITEKWKGKETKIIQEGGNGDSVNIEAFGTSFTSLLTGGDICLARPVKARK